MDKIHATSLKVLEEVGVSVQSELVSKMLVDAGAGRSEDGHRVLIPEHMVKAAIASAPKTVLLASRDGKNDITIPSDQRMFVANGGEGVYVRNLVTGEAHNASSKDLADFAILADSLPEIDFFWPMVGALEQPVHLKGMTEAKVSIEYTTKHIQAMAADGPETNHMIQMASIVTGGVEELERRPIFSAVQCPISPLTFEKGLTEAQIEFAKHNIPVVAMAASVCGLTSPITLTGTIAQVNAENLASLVISQAARKGAPFVYSTDSCPGDLKTGNIDYMALEVPLLRAGLGQMARRYRLPSMVCAIGVDTNSLSMESAAEGVPLMSLPALVPSDLASGFGGIDNALGASLEQMVADAWIWGLTKELTRTFDSDSAAISFETIRDAGIDGNFLGKRHTISRFRKEVAATRHPELANKKLPQNRGELVRKARAEVERLLAKKDSLKVTREESRAMEDYIRRMH